jgi:hypothetical protein
MPLHVWLAAVLQLAVMLAVAGGCFAASRRCRILQHPLSIILFVTYVGVIVAVAGAVYRFGWSEVPAMAGHSVIGSAGWGVIIAATAWGARRVFGRLRS